jgi:HAD superfamily phosphatase (TIGR01668 family)
LAEYVIIEKGLNKWMVNSLFDIFCPNLIVDSLYDIKTQSLQARGISGIIFDLDNTIVPWGTKDLCSEMVDWIQALKQNGFKICLLSNNTSKRVEDIAKMLDIPFVSKAFKPFKNGFRQAASAMQLPGEKVAVIGDQLFTDVLGGNRLGMFTVWVKPLSTKEFVGTKITRQVEKMMVRILKDKGLMH